MTDGLQIGMVGGVGSSAAMGKPTDLQQPKMRAALERAPAPSVAAAPDTTITPKADIDAAGAMPAAAVPPEQPQLDPIDAAYAARGLPPPKRGLPQMPKVDEDASVMGAAWDAETIRTDAWGYAEKLRREKTLEMWDRLPAANKEKINAARFDKNNNWKRLEHMLVEEVRAVAQTTPEAAMLMRDMPQSIEAFDAQIDNQRRAELEEAQTILDQDGGAIAEFVGAGARGLTDPTSLATLPFGGPAGRGVYGVLKFAAVEAGINAGAELALAPRKHAVASELGIATPNTALDVGIAAGAGFLFGGTLAGVPRVLSYAAARRAPIEQAVRNGESVLDADAAVDAAEAQMRGDTTIVEEIGMPPQAAEPSPLAQILGSQQSADLGGVDFNFSAGGNAAPNTNRVGYVFGKLVEYGYPPHVVAGLLGNLMQESGPGLNTRAVGDGGNAFGMGQWNGPRMRALNAFARKKGTDPASLTTQIDFLHHELQGNERAALDQILRAPDAASAAAIASDVFWRPGIPHKANRVAFARSLAEQFDGGKVPMWKGANIQADGGGMPEYTPTTRGYTGANQVRVSDDLTLDVEYQVVDLSTLIRASGDLQPRDRSKLNSDVWIAETAARFDPIELMPYHNAAHGSPIVGPDNIIESGNGRSMILERVYEYHPDRAEVYKTMLQNKGFEIPEGVTRPIVIARRKTELTHEQRVGMVNKGQDSGVAETSATEKARMGADGLNPTRMALYRPELEISDPANKPFVRSFLESLSASVRMVASDAGEGALSSDGRLLLRQAMFARAWPDFDLVEMMTENDYGDLKSLMDALIDVSPQWAGLRADIAAGKIDEAFDITGYVLDAMRMIAEVRVNARRAGQKLGPAMQDFLDTPDMLDGAIAPLTQALLRKFWANGQPASADKVADFLRRYVSDARAIGEGGGGMFDAPTPADVLRALDDKVFGDLTDDFGPMRGFARAGDDIAAPVAEVSPAPTIMENGFDDGAASAEAADVDAVIRGEIEAETQRQNFGPVYSDIKDDPEAAIQKLFATKTGEVPQAMTLPKIGPIRFIWGGETLGLQHILSKHGKDVLFDLPNALRQGTIVRQTNDRVYIEAYSNPKRRTVIRLDFDGDNRPWVLTSHDLVQGTDAQPGRTSNVLTDAAPPSVPDATARRQDMPNDADDQDAIRAELAAARAELADDAGIAQLGGLKFSDFEFPLNEGANITPAKLLKKIDAETEKDQILQLCKAGGPQ